MTEKVSNINLIKLTNQCHLVKCLSIDSLNQYLAIVTSDRIINKLPVFHY